MPSSASGNSDVSLPRWRAERLRHYRRRFPGPERRYKGIRVSDENVNALVKRGYLRKDEVDDERAIRQALSLFAWDALIGDARQIGKKDGEGFGDRTAPRSRSR
jgi:hypothetical protein